MTDKSYEANAVKGFDALKKQIKKERDDCDGNRNGKRHRKGYIAVREDG